MAITGIESGHQTVTGLSSISLSGLSAVAQGSTEARTLATRFSDVINVKDYGATGDGVTNDTTALQAAVSALTSGGRLFFPPGTYYLAGTLTLADDNVEVDGPGATIVQHSNNTPSIYGTGLSDIKIWDLTLTGVGSGDTAETGNGPAYGVNARAYGIWLVSCTRVRVQNVVATNHRNAGLVLYQSSNVVVEHCKFTGTRGTGAYVTPGSADAGIPDGDGNYQQYGVWIVGGRGEAITGVACASDITVRDTYVGETHHGVYVGANNDKVTLDNLTWGYLGQHGIYWVPFARARIVGCRGESYLTNKFQATWTTCYNNPYDLEVRDSYFEVVNGNAFEAVVSDDVSGSTPIRASTYLDDVRIVNNVFKSSATSGLLLSSIRRLQSVNNTYLGPWFGVYTYSVDGVIEGGQVGSATVSCGDATHSPIQLAPTAYMTTHVRNVRIVNTNTSSAPDNYVQATYGASVGAPRAWVASQYWGLGAYCINGTNVYKVVTAGVSASSGGPTGVGTGIADGTVAWDFVVASASADTGTIILERIQVKPSSTEPTYSLRVSGTNLRLRGLDFGTSTKLINVAAALTSLQDDGRSVHGGWNPGSPYSSFNESPGIPRRDFYSTAAPVSGTWQLGDRMWNTAPSAGGTLLWVCTTGGTPGTWKAVAIAA